MTQTISTIVDMNSVRNSMIMVYMTQTISTIVDCNEDRNQDDCLYDPNNFYYCRFR